MRSGRALILTYHRVGAGRDPFGQAVAADTFAAQMAILPSLGDVVPLRQLERPGGGRRIAITFDDGYADNALAAAPILRSAGLPATFFVPGRVIDQHGEYWWDRLEHFHLDEAPRVETLTLTIRGRPLTIDVRSPAGRLRSLKALNRRLRLLRLDEIEALLEEIRVLLGAEPVTVCDRHALISSQDLLAMAADPLFEIGSHAWTHTMLSALPRDEQAWEIAESRRALEEATVRDVTSLAYPYGIDESFDATTVALVREAGYERACANLAGLVSSRDGFRLARNMVHDWAADEFAGQVRRWFDEG